MKTIGIDARFYGEAGPGRYVKAVIQHLEKIDQENQYYIFLRKRGFEEYIPSNSNFVKVLADYKWYSFQEQIFFLTKLLKYHLNLFYVPHFNIPILYPGKLVTAIPDLIMHTFSTEKGTTLPKPYFKFKKLIYKMVFWWAVLRSSKVIVPSKAVIEDFKKVYPQFSENKYVLAYEGVDPDYLKAENKDSEQVLNSLNIKRPFLLYVGSAYEHKNLKRLISAFKLLIHKYGFTGQLVIIGKKDKFSEELKKLVESEGLTEKVLLPGLTKYITDKEIVALRQNAGLYVFPSLKEGFSLTPMEAQALGLPAIISDIPVHREIYADSVSYFNPENENDMAEKIHNLLCNADTQKDLKEKGLTKYKEFSWETTAKITREVFDKLLRPDEL